MSVRGDIERRLMSVKGLSPRESRYGHGLAFYVGRREVVHFHGEERMDVRLTAALIERRGLQGGRDDRVRREGGTRDWVRVRLSEESDVALAIALAEEAVRANS